jgi:hypothetical protein
LATISLLRLQSRTSFKNAFLGVYALTISAVIFGAFFRWAYDDPFITYRYAVNLARGVGFVYNPGEYVLSTTTPLFTLLLASLSVFSSDLPRLANLVGAFSLALGALFLWDLAHTWKTPAVGWIALLLYPTFPLLVMTLGSETPLYLALCLGAFAFYARRNLVISALFAALAILARPDGLLIVTILAAHHLFRTWLGYRDNMENKGSPVGGEGEYLSTKPVIPWRALAVFFLLTVPWFLFALSYFGSPFPATLSAKQQQGAMAISQSFFSGFGTILEYYRSQWQYWIQAILAVLGFTFILSRERRWLILLVWTVLYFTSYSILGVSRYFWYYAPLVPGFLVLVGLGVQLALRQNRNERSFSKDERWSWFPLVSGRFAGTLILVVMAVLFLRQLGDLWTVRSNPDQRFAIYREAGEWLRKNTRMEDRVGALEVGIIGYYADRAMVDFAGLIQPQVAAQLTADSTYEDSAAWAIEHFRPNYLVLTAGHFPNLGERVAGSSCSLVKVFLGSTYSYPADLTIYKCP